MAPRHSFTSFLVLLFFFSLITFVTPQQGATCDSENPCKSGCCSKAGNCGFGDEYCKPEVCISTCNATAECGKWAETPGSECPLNVCCSKWGFCGTTSEFCTFSGGSNDRVEALAHFLKSFITRGLQRIKIEHKCVDAIRRQRTLLGRTMKL